MGRPSRSHRPHAKVGGDFGILPSTRFRGSTVVAGLRRVSRLRNIYYLRAVARHSPSPARTRRQVILLRTHMLILPALPMPRPQSSRSLAIIINNCREVGPVLHEYLYQELGTFSVRPRLCISRPIPELGITLHRILSAAVERSVLCARSYYLNATQQAYRGGSPSWHPSILQQLQSVFIRGIGVLMHLQSGAKTSRESTVEQLQASRWSRL